MIHSEEPSNDDDDILESYKRNANGYLTQPLDLDPFLRVVGAIEDYWLTLVTLPRA